jgi:hypothetical protein
MRTLILALTVLLLTAPVWATVEITTSLSGNDLTIGYTSDEGMVRAFALNIVATGGNITAIGGYTPGDDNSTYGIFPGSFDEKIVVDAETGLVVSWGVAGYTPVAPSDDPGALGPIGGSQITIEMGSLYPEGGNAPPEASGDLCTITVDPTVTEICITANAIRGNVVLEDANEPDTLVVSCVDGPGAGGDLCYPTDDAVRYARWVFLGEPDCWCPVGTGDINGEPSRGKQCYGDTDNVLQYDFYEVYTDDLAIFAADWKALCTDQLANACSDLTHVCQFDYYAVYTDDLARLVLGWKATLGDLTADCPEILSD